MNNVGSLPKRAYRKARRTYTQVKEDHPAFDRIVGQNVNKLKRSLVRRVPTKPRTAPRLSPIQRSEEIDVLLTCTLGRVEPLHQGLVDIVERLNTSGLTSRLLCREGEVLDAMQEQLGEVALPFSFSALVAGKGLPKVPQAASLPGEEELDTLILEDRAFRKKDLTEPIAVWEREHMERFYNYWNAFLRKHQVKVLMTWGETATTSKLLIRLARELKIEHYVLERGHFPGTLYVDPLGQYGSGARQRSLRIAAWKSQVRPASTDERFKEISAWYWGLPEIVVSSDEGQRELDEFRKLKASGRQIITILGANDAGAGVKGDGRSRLDWVRSSREVFDYVHSVVQAKFPGAFIAYRPHPSDVDLPPTTEHASVAKHANMHQLIELSDLCINVGSTSYAVCQLQEKPTITLGPTDALGYGEQNTVVDKTLLLPLMRQYLWGEQEADRQAKELIVDMFDNWLVGCTEFAPTRLRAEHIARLLFERISLWKSKYALAMTGRERGISAVMCNEIMSRERRVFINEDPADTRYNGLTVIVPIYGDYEGTRRLLRTAVANQVQNGYRLILIWDRGPDLRLQELVHEYDDRPNITVIENKENVGFSGTVNSAILKSAPDDVILLNSDAVVSTDWARRLQHTAYAHPKLATVVPFSNNATAWNVPFPDGQRLPQENTIEWVRGFDDRAKTNGPRAVEMPTNHGFCLFIKRSVMERIGLFDEMKFGVGQSEDNEFAMRLRAAGYYTGCAVNVFVGHDGSTSFADWDQWRAHGRQVLTEEFSHYIKEVRHFYSNDPLHDYREVVMGDEEVPEQAWPGQSAPEQELVVDGLSEDSLEEPSERTL